MFYLSITDQYVCGCLNLTLSLRSQVSSCSIVFNFLKNIILFNIFCAPLYFVWKRWINQKQDIVNEYCVLPCTIWWKIACSSPKHLQCSRQKHFVVRSSSWWTANPQSQGLPKRSCNCLTPPSGAHASCKFAEWRNDCPAHPEALGQQSSTQKPKQFF